MRKGFILTEALMVLAVVGLFAAVMASVVQDAAGRQHALSLAQISRR